MIKLENKLYSSTEVAEILGVSLRSVYRYLEEDKLTAEVKTATGRHRFTRQNIIDFLYPKGIPEGEKEKILAKEESETEASEVTQEKVEVKEKTPLVEEEVVTEPVEEEVKETPKEEPKEESVDWLSKFREAAKKFEETPEETSAPVEEKVEEVTGLAAETSEEPETETQKMYYYRSRLGGLKDIAQNIDKTARNSGLDYAFTMNAGLSLYKPISPFSVLHAYIRSKDRDFFERILTLTPSDEGSAQLCLVVSDDDTLFKGSDELHGLKVVEKKRLVEDISELDEKLLKEAEGIL